MCFTNPAIPLARSKRRMNENSREFKNIATLFVVKCLPDKFILSASRRAWAEPWIHSFKCDQYHPKWHYREVRIGTKGKKIYFTEAPGTLIMLPRYLHRTTEMPVAKQLKQRNYTPKVLFQIIWLPLYCFENGMEPYRERTYLKTNKVLKGTGETH